MNSERNRNNTATFHGLAFLAAQSALLVLAITTVFARLRDDRFDQRLPALRPVPRVVSPLYDDPRVATDQQLRSVLYKLRPLLRSDQPKMNHIDHALRFWGVEATFRDPACLSGAEMRALLTNHDLFAKAWGENEAPFLSAAANGVDVRTKDGHASSSHVDHTLAGLAEVGTPLDFQLHTGTGSSTMRAMLENSFLEFNLNQGEYEWSALAYALYTRSGEPWISSEGQQITFDRIADRIMRQRLREGVCYGNHRLHALAILLRVDEQQPLLSSESRAAVVQHLQKATATLLANQHAYGFWNGNWTGKDPLATSAEQTDRDSRQRRVLATGHALEWWALAPSEVQPPREAVIRAGQWLSQAILEMTESQIEKDFTFLSHAGRALALWRGHFPAHYAATLDTPDVPASDTAVMK